VREKFYFTIVDIVLFNTLSLIGQHCSIPLIVQQVFFRGQQLNIPQHTGACIWQHQP